MKPQEKRGVGRPSQGKQRRYFTLSADTTKVIDALPAGERSRFVDEAIREQAKIMGEISMHIALSSQTSEGK